MGDVAARLRDYGLTDDPYVVVQDPAIIEEAAAEITRLRGLLDQARAVLAVVSERAPAQDPGPPIDDFGMWNSYGNYDDVASDAAQYLAWELAVIARPVLAAIDAEQGGGDAR